MPVCLRATLAPLAALLALVVAPLALVAAPASAAPRTAASASTPTAAASAAVAERRAERRSAQLRRVHRALGVAQRQRGDVYRYGAAGPDAFDCSGLVYYATHRAGFSRVPRTSSQQAGFMRRISRQQMRPGDFVFFTSGSGVYHVGFYAGRRDGRRVIVHAPSTGSRVRTEAIWTNSWFPGTLRR